MYSFSKPSILIENRQNEMGEYTTDHCWTSGSSLSITYRIPICSQFDHPTGHPCSCDLCFLLDIGHLKVIWYWAIMIHWIMGIPDSFKYVFPRNNKGIDILRSKYFKCIKSIHTVEKFRLMRGENYLLIYTFPTNMREYTSSEEFYNRYTRLNDKKPIKNAPKIYLDVLNMFIML